MWFDLLVIAAALLGMIAGAWKGLAWQLAGIGSFVLGFFLGLPLASFIAGGMHEPSTFTRFLIFAMCYAGISLACYGVALFLRMKLEAFKLERFDKHVGAFAGA
ncbi:MAG TPA: CvpA family protein, partial [Planctomycetota bacterium]|nr:CvpA family protein [Planctomycetota bacterium]